MYRSCATSPPRRPLRRPQRRHPPLLNAPLWRQRRPFPGGSSSFPSWDSSCAVHSALSCSSVAGVAGRTRRRSFVTTPPQVPRNEKEFISLNMLCIDFIGIGTKTDDNLDVKAPVDDADLMGQAGLAQWNEANNETDNNVVEPEAAADSGESSEATAVASSAGPAAPTVVPAITVTDHTEEDSVFEVPLTTDATAVL